MSIVGCNTVIIDGALHHQALQRLVLAVHETLGEVNHGEASRVAVHQGSRARKPLTLGAACLPLAERFFPENGKSG
ncbi:hypothetical protein [Martelella soudanensis]|uniref:hypothetical protein n=1 Tax=unclassified Martelella TaxID=2629616 RepID=UPI0015DEC357|nr:MULTISPECIES: hypothetical protein [unclassified Martelella]